MGFHELDPAIINRIRAESGVGPDSIQHAHHRPPIVPQPRMSEESLTTEQVETTHDLEPLPAKANILSALFRTARTAVTGGRRQGDDPTST